MQEKRKKVILGNRKRLLETELIERAERDGIELEKGASNFTELKELLDATDFVAENADLVVLQRFHHEHRVVVPLAGGRPPCVVI